MTVRRGWSVRRADAVAKHGTERGGGEAVAAQGVGLTGKGGYEPGRIADLVERRLSESEWNAVLEKLRAADFMALPSHEESMGLDGAQWILEANVFGRYHMVDRWSDAQPLGYHETCLHLLKLAGSSVPEDEMY